MRRRPCPTRDTATTDLFHKRELLYALGEDRTALEHGAVPVLVEGALDRLAIRQAVGQVGVVGLAPLGTRLTEQHVDTLVDAVGLQRPIAVCFDSDPAGQQATLAAWELLKAARGPRDGALLHIGLPAGHDPADLVQSERGDELRHRLSRPAPLANVVADIKIGQAGQLDHIAKKFGLRDLVQEVPHLHQSAVSGYLAHVGRRLGVDHQSVTQEAVDQLAGSDDLEAELARTTSAASSPRPLDHHARSREPRGSAAPRTTRARPWHRPLTPLNTGRVRTDAGGGRRSSPCGQPGVSISTTWVLPQVEDRRQNKNSAVSHDRRITATLEPCGN